MQMKKMLQKKKSLSQKTYLDAGLIMPAHRKTVLSTLRRTLLVIGMVLMAMGAYAQEATGGLYMHKTWVPDETNCPDGSCGHIRLETFVTGETMVVDVNVPTDIVVVVDQSGSMDDDFNGNSTNNNANKRITALKTALRSFLQTVKQDAIDTDCDHKVAIVGFAAGDYTFSNETYHNTELLTPSVVNYRNLTPASTAYQNALILATDYAQNNSSVLNTAVNNIDAGGGTSMQLGLEMAYNDLANRTTTTFVDPNNEVHDRAQVVVFFTDGYPGRYSMPYTSPSLFTNDWICEGYFRGRDSFWDNWTTMTFDQKTVADAAVTQANNIKGLGASVFSVGIFTGADPDAANRTTQGSYTNNQSNGTYWNTGKSGANGLLHFISSDYAEGEATSWSGLTTSTNNVAGYKNNGFYLAADNAEALANIFTQIAEQTGGAAISMGVETIVQDAIAPDFNLNFPEGTQPSAAIIAYAPKCTGKDGNTLQFDEINDNGTLTLVDGVVTGGGENKLPNGLVTFNEESQTLQFTNFNFDEMWCGSQTDHGQITYHGRKLVLMIPLVVDEDTWGDGIQTNTSMSVIFPNGDMLNPIEYNLPIADVMGEVWTEVVINKPPTFNENADPIPLTTPEDLAWFISWVNGRAGYEDNSDVAPHPNANAILMADVDMSAHCWVPIGMQTYDTHAPNAYAGTFDGNGHVITGLKNNATKYYKLNERAMVYPGMFSNVKGTVKNLFVLDADFHAKNHLLKPEDEHKTFIHFGIIADTLSSTGKIFNCEAVGNITSNNNADNLSRDELMIFGGLVGYNNGGTIHSTMAMAELTGYTLGGAVGLNNGQFSNSFTNGVYNYLDNDIEGKYVGGIAAQNTGTINNCYVRFERDNQNLDKTNFGMLVGTGTAPTNSYTPQIVTWSRPDHLSETEAINTNSTVPNTITDPQNNPATSYTLTVSPTFYNMFTNDNMTGGTWGTWGGFNVYNNGTPLLKKLNDGKGEGASWKRTTAGVYSDGAGDINDDYPVLVFPEYTCLGSADGIRIDYAASMNEMLHRHNNGNFNENTALEGNKYKPTNHAAIYKGAINLYAHDDVTLEQPQPGGKDGETVADNSTAAGVVVYIDENISLLQDASSSIEAYTGQTLKAFDNTSTESGNRWHNISSSLEDSEFGWHYGDEGVVPSALGDDWESWAASHSYEGEAGNMIPRDPKNPCFWILPISDEDQAFFPIDIASYHRAEFYCFYEPQYHWLNFRRNSDSHWHMDNPELNIPYSDQEDHFIPGKGYLSNVDMSQWWSFTLNGTTYSKKAQFMQNRGTLNNGTITIPVTYTAANEWTGLAGYNLLGNPYQSYLDFTTFAWANSSLWNAASEMTFAIYDPETGNYVQGVAGAQPSEGSMATTGDINMHQGFFIRVSNDGTATFNNGMRFNTPADGTHFRGERLNYPVINLIATDNEGNTDIAVLEVGRPENGGGEKLRVGSATGRISLRHDNTDFGILFSDMTEGSQPLRFEAQEDGTFTLSWNTANANFSSLTLVDNITGVNYDMLAHDSYEFEGRASDYKSRFKILIGEFTDVEENEETVTNNFAFFDGSEWVVNGKGQLTVTDVMGRMVYSDNLTNDQNRVSLNGLSQGVYLMQVRNGNGAMVQKIVVR